MSKINEDGVVGSPPMNNTGNAAGLGNNPPGPSSVIARIRRKRVTTEEPTEPMPEPSKEEHIDTVFVSRTLRNSEDLLQWAIKSGLINLVGAENLHTTIAFSRAPVDIDTLDLDLEPVVISGGPRCIELLGDTAIVLRFESQDLKERWNYFKTKGCSWDYDVFKPHVTITWKDQPSININEIIPYDGVLFFGPEIYKPINPKFL